MPADQRAPPLLGGWRGRVSAVLLGITVSLAMVSLVIGPVGLSPASVARAFLPDADEVARTIVMELRLPRTLLGVMIGAALGASGAALQGLLRNPLADPSLFGAPQAAAFGAVATISLGLTDALSFSLPVVAIGGALVSVCLLIAVVGRHASLMLLILGGLAVSSAAGAATALAMNLAPNPYAALEIAFWLLGSLQDRSLHHVAMALPFIAASIAIIASRRHAFRALTLGEDVAQSLGVQVAHLRLLIVLAVALGIGASVAVAGAIGFVGLIAPHLARGLVGYDPSRLILPSALIGASLLTAADIAVRLIPSSSDIKVGVLTALIGVPFFLYLIVRERRRLGAEALQ